MGLLQCGPKEVSNSASLFDVYGFVAAPTRLLATCRPAEEEFGVEPLFVANVNFFFTLSNLPNKEFAVEPLFVEPHCTTLTY
jgi:hypothetical protein